MLAFTLIEAPYHMGLAGVAVGKGPARLLDHGADHLLARDGEPAQVVHIRKRDDSAEGLDAVVDVNRQIRYAVRDAREAGSLPVVLAGNCNSAIGTLAGLDGRLGVVWFDAHGDFNTPETTISGSLEGMALAVVAGDCHEDLRQRIGLIDPVEHANIVLLGSRDLDPGERARLAASRVALRMAGAMDDAGELLAGLASGADAVYLHIDVDVLDGVPEMESLIGTITRTLPLGAIAFTNYNPDLDRGDRTLNFALRLLAALAAVR